MTDNEPAPDYFTVGVDGKQVWHTNGFGEEYDAIHAAAGALLAGAESVTVRRHNGCEEGDNE